MVATNKKNKGFLKNNVVFISGDKSPHMVASIFMIYRSFLLVYGSKKD
jgi:hypothetical protein